MKTLYKSEQSGRSMVEMLGVLAIIGVLSVGGIAGYSKAMAKFKTSKYFSRTFQICQANLCATCVYASKSTTFLENFQNSRHKKNPGKSRLSEVLIVFCI